MAEKNKKIIGKVVAVQGAEDEMFEVCRNLLVSAFQ